ncbi:alpha/beta fold hydrolase [Sphingomonas solaris]|uniref:Alpha/beta hydrolase n=1 Tax=Alterirhizorhabdus solaris TaxID=2529389 RepID=A0A558RB82_9SPHN|nr:alpha/beta hydrolase [Sphingomonas solaris]TVV76659.1 alpha/beta hydrolase [Sphingomonas solaris]
MPRFTTPDGGTLHYRLRGAGPLIALTPGGREPGEAVSALADALAPDATVLTWDRRNTGASDLTFHGESEQAIWAGDLGALIDHLGRGPAWLAGGSAGCRVSVATALCRPDTAAGLLLWSASGGAYGCQFLGFSYHVPYLMAAARGGMAAVAETPFFAERIACNPASRDRLLALDPDAFVAMLRRWNEAFYHRGDCTLAGVPDAALATIALPTLIFEGDDDVHPPEVSRAMARLIPHATLRASPWPREAWIDRFSGRMAGSVFDLYPLLAPAIIGFIGAAR